MELTKNNKKFQKLGLCSGKDTVWKVTLGKKGPQEEW